MSSAYPAASLENRGAGYPHDMDGEHSFAAIEETFRRTVAALDRAGVPFLLGGTLACWARGGPEARNDLDFVLKEEDAEPALAALVGAGMRSEHPPEDWLVKAWDGEVLVDLIHHPIGLEVTDEVIARGTMHDVAAMRVRVMALEDVLTSKLLALGEHSLDLESALGIARALREQIDWSEVRARTSSSPYARAFLSLLSELGIVAPEASAASHPPPRVRVVS
jgi:Nucleotidyl transferase of unknown function (DUF2204)